MIMGCSEQRAQLVAFQLSAVKLGISLGWFRWSNTPDSGGAFTANFLRATKHKCFIIFN